MAGSGVKVIQINLHHCKGASAVLARSQSVAHTAISLIQEPWVVCGSIRGLAGCGRPFRPPAESNPRACLTVKGLDATILPELCSRDLVAVEIGMDEAGMRRRMIISSAYFPHGEDGPPPHMVIKLLEFCERRNIPLIIGCDANAHHLAWGSTDINERGRRLLEFLATKLEIRNRGSEPTFCTAVRREVIDLTLCSREITRTVAGWRVVNEPSLSDHRQIAFELTNVKPKVVWARNPRRTNWGSFQVDLESRLTSFPKKYGTAEELEACVDHLQSALVSSFENNCPIREVRNAGGPSWWNQRLQELRRRTRRAWNRARNSRCPSEWARYRTAQAEYKRAVLKAKEDGWKKFCESTELPVASRLCKILAKDPSAKLEAIRLQDDTLVTGEQCLVHLLDTNFPGFVRDLGRLEMLDRVPRRVIGLDWGLAAAVVRPDYLRWAVLSFKPYKAAGPDKIFPVLLKEGLEQITGPLCRLLRACIALGYTPSAWKLAKVVFIPKAGRIRYTNAKDFRPICLTSFVLKTLEKLVDRYIRDEILVRYPLHPGQHAYRANRSTETALHSAVTAIEGQLERGGYCVGIFLDIEGAFNNTPHEVICREAERHGVPRRLIECVRGALGREVVANLDAAEARGWVDRGCPQGGGSCLPYSGV